MALTTYQRTIVRYTDPDDQRVIEETLATWSSTRIGRTVVPNLMVLERFLPEDSMYTLLSVIKANHTEPIDNLQIEYENECHSHIARGGNVPITTVPPLVGKAVDRTYFANWLWRNYPYKFVGRAEAELFIDDLRARAALDPVEKSILFGSKFLIWVTWSQDSHTDNPFHFIRLNLADEARANLGLPPNPGESLLLFIYQRPPALDLSRPTIADAGLFTYFQPAPPLEERHGWTVPWETEFLSGALHGYVPQPRPEAVHRAAGATLESLIKVEQLP